MKKLYRSKKNRMLFGVCAGFAEYFDTDPTIVRLLFALTTIAWGAGLLVYLASALIVPEEPFLK